MKVIIAGGRHFKDYQFLSKKCDFYLSRIKDDIEIVSGGQVTIDEKTGEKYGADYLGEEYAKERGYRIKKFPANWNLHGKKAGPVRNWQMGKYCNQPEDCLIAFWDGESRGTKNMIETAKELKLNTRTVYY